MGRHSDSNELCRRTCDFECLVSDISSQIDWGSPSMGERQCHHRVRRHINDRVFSFNDMNYLSILTKILGSSGTYQYVSDLIPWVAESDRLKWVNVIRFIIYSWKNVTIVWGTSRWSQCDDHGAWLSENAWILYFFPIDYPNKTIKIIVYKNNNIRLWPHGSR